MDQHTYDNWVKIKATFEASGNTNNMFYSGNNYGKEGFGYAKKIN